MDTEKISEIGNIAIISMTPEAMDFLEEIMAAWEIPAREMIESAEIRGVEYEPSIYAFAYWLVRYSGLIESAKKQIENNLK